MRAPLFLFRSYGSSSEVIETDVCVIDAQRVEQVEDGLGHHRTTAQVMMVVLNVLGGVMLLEVGVTHALCRRFHSPLQPPHALASARNESARVAERERPLSNHVTSKSS